MQPSPQSKYRPFLSTQKETQWFLLLGPRRVFVVFYFIFLPVCLSALAQRNAQTRVCYIEKKKLYYELAKTELGAYALKSQLPYGI